MITYSNVQGFLKSKNARQWLVAIWITVTVLSPSALLWYMLEKSLDQTQRSIAIAQYWEREAGLWKNYSKRVLIESYYLLPGGKDGIQCDAVRCWNVQSGSSVPAPVTENLCSAGASKCDADKCWQVCTGVPAMDVKP